MREIKFRAWDKKDRIMLPLGEEDKEFVLVLSSGEVLENGEGVFYPTENNLILMQYTGLKDKQGRDIYEGDIIRGYNGKVYEVVFGSMGGGFFMDWYDYSKKEGSRQLIGDYYNAVVYTRPSSSVNSQGKKEHDRWSEKYTPEIVGNIYETPALLEEQK